MTQRIYSSPSLSALVFAKEFREKKSDQKYQYTQNRLESLGNKLQWLVVKSSDTLLREIKNPVTIIALTTLALFSVTIAFYPSSALLVATKVLPPLSKIQPWMLKMALYIAIQSAVLGIGLRGLGRLSNKTLYENWKRAELEAVFVGDRR